MVSKPVYRIRWWNLLVIFGLLGACLDPGILRPAPSASAAPATRPVVAIHVSELTQAMETMPAVPPTPTDPATTGFEWWYRSWHYFVIYESLRTAFEADGTPYVLVSDADIAAGALMDGSSPRYPIVFSLTTEAVNDNEIQPLRDYVNAGGFLFMGGSALTRNPDGTTRGNFALASEMGMSMTDSTLLNWDINSAFTRLSNHRLVSHIPGDGVPWDMLTTSEDIPWTYGGAQYIWRTASSGAEVIAAGNIFPLLTTRPYGEGRFIYHAIFNPIVSAGGGDTGMYAYTIYRSAVEWAFEAAGLPIVKRSPWPYEYDSAFIARHDFENNVENIGGGGIENSSMYEASIGVKGEYYFCTGALRTFSGDQQAYIDSVRRAVSLYGATIGSHNGGYPNIGVSDPDSYFYWHWGPDELLDVTSGFPDPYGSYTSGYDYSRDSIQISFQDIEGWLAGLDNGRPGCGTAGDCPRTWVSPFFNSSRDRSARIVSELGSITSGEQKISPFPYRTLSYDPATPGRRYNTISIPTSEWYLDGLIMQAIEGHTDDSIRALVDFYHQKGYLVNLYGHLPSDSGLMKTYVDWALGRSRMWSTNSIGLRDWYVSRETLQVMPTVTRYGNTTIANAAITGAADPQAAIELVLPNWAGGAVQDMTVYLNGVQAAPPAYRATSYGVKVLVGTTVSNVQVVYSTESPSAVTLSAFSADASLKAVWLNWETASELELAGFNLYRSETASGLRQKLNAVLITGKKPGQMAGAAYQFADPVPAGRKYYYWLEVVGRDETTVEGPVVIISNHLIHIPLTIH